MTEELKSIIRADIERCEKHTSREGSSALFQALVSKYNGIFPDFEQEIPQSGKCGTPGIEFDYRPELNAIKEKLQVILSTEKNNDPLYDFKAMVDEDLNSLQFALSDFRNSQTPECAKQQLYQEITAKYHTCIPKLGYGLYNYNITTEIYDEVSGESLFHNLRQIYNKILTYKKLGYPGFQEKVNSAPSTVVQVTNNNENRIDVDISFNSVREKVKGMSALPEAEIDEILHKIDEIEDIVHSSDCKAKKWENAKNIIKWIADKGVDVGITLLPLLLQIK